MEWIMAHKQELRAALKKYRLALLVLLAGIGLMLLPTGQQSTESPAAQPTEPETSLQESLEAILGQIAGAGEVRVLLTEKSGAETVYQMNEDRTAGDDREDTRREAVLISDGSREKSGLVRKINRPTYQGAVVVCQGADSPAVRLAIAQAVKSATGLTADCISVLKMK